MKKTTYAALLVAYLTVMTTQSQAACKAASQERASERELMIKTQIESRGIKNGDVLGAIRCVPRHVFVPKNVQKMAYADGPLPIGQNQTISQPYIVAFMTEAAKLKPTDKVLEIGTGSGYQAAVLAELVKDVYTIEIVEELGKSAQKTLADLGYKNVRGRIGDGYKGWPQAAPFDVIFVTAAPDRIPEPLVAQLKVGGRFIIPIGESRQHLVRVLKTEKGLEEQSLLPVSFVPMTGEIGKPRIKAAE